MSTEKIPNIFGSLADEVKGGVFSVTDKVYKKTVLDVLRKKHPEKHKATLSYRVGSDHPKNFAISHHI